MALMVRMLEKQKWAVVVDFDKDYKKTPADTITKELKTDSNNLSLWKIQSDSELLDAILAIAVSRNEIARLDIVIFDDAEFANKGLNVKNTPENGLCPIESFNQFHYDLENLDYEKLGLFSSMIIDKIEDETKCIRYGRGSIKRMVITAFKEGKIPEENLSKKLLEEIKKATKTD